MEKLDAPPFPAPSTDEQRHMASPATCGTFNPPEDSALAVFDA